MTNQTGSTADAHVHPLDGPEAARSQGESSLVRQVHRIFRGRYLLALTLALSAGAAGAWLGYRSQAPIYKSEGWIFIDATTPTPLDPAGERVLPEINAFVARQVKLLESSTELALTTETWQRTGRAHRENAAAEFQRSRLILGAPGALHIGIEFVADDPDVALAGVSAIIEAYEKSAKEVNSTDARLQPLETRAMKLSGELKASEEAITAAAKEFGGVDGLEFPIELTQTQLTAAVRRLADLEARRVDLQFARSTLQPPRTMTEDEIALQSTSMSDALHSLRAAEVAESNLAKRVGDLNEELTAARQEVQLRRDRVARLKDTYNERLSQESVRAETLDANLRQLETLITAVHAEVNSLTDRQLRLQTAQREIVRHRADRARIEGELGPIRLAQSHLSIQLFGKGNVRIGSRGSRPTLAFKDRRILMGGVGAVGGSALALLLLALVSIRDRRMKDMQDLGATLSTIRSLGVLPSIVRDDQDPESVESAAHCVHQVRAHLQILHARRGDACFAVTSGAVGTGKTTVSLAMGLSFAQSGARTLLVDADLHGRGLTWRVAQGLLTHCTSLVAGDVDGRMPAGTVSTDEASLRLLARIAPIDPAKSDAGAADLVALLESMLERFGPEAARRSGMLAELFAADELLSRGDARTALSAALERAVRGGRPASLSEASMPPPAHIEVDPLTPLTDMGPLEQYLYPTGIENLRLLPLRGLEAGANLSVASIESLLRRLRGEFDVVLVDTGPVMGAVETPLFATHVDGVTLVVSPHDHRPDAEAALVRLRQLGARVDGVVFNRASSREVIRLSQSRSRAVAAAQR